MGRFSKGKEGTIASRITASLDALGKPLCEVKILQRIFGTADARTIVRYVQDGRILGYRATKIFDEWVILKED